MRGRGTGGEGPRRGGSQQSTALPSDLVLAYMHCEHVSKHHVTHPARDNTGTPFLFQEVSGAENDTPKLTAKQKPVFGGFREEHMHGAA